MHSIVQSALKSLEHTIAEIRTQRHCFDSMKYSWNMQLLSGRKIVEVGCAQEVKSGACLVTKSEA